MNKKTKSQQNYSRWIVFLCYTFLIKSGLHYDLAIQEDLSDLEDDEDDRMLSAAELLGGYGEEEEEEYY